eukprot:UN28903
MVSDKTPETKDAREAMQHLLKFTHYLPRSWIQNAHMPHVKQEFQSLYQSKVAIVFNELFNVLFNPFILMFTLPDCAEKIVEFVLLNSINISGVGTICKFSQLKIDQTGFDENNADVEEPLIQSHGDRVVSSPLKDGKLEKSIVTFAMNHPRWQTDPIQTDLLLSVAEMGDTISIQHSHSSNNKKGGDGQGNGKLDKSRFGVASRVDSENPLNMSFSALLGNIKPKDQNSRMNNNNQLKPRTMQQQGSNNSTGSPSTMFMDSMIGDFEGINLLASTQNHTARKYTRTVLEKCSYMFPNLEQQIHDGTVSQILQKSQMSRKQIVMPPTEFHLALPEESEKERISKIEPVIFKPPKSSIPAGLGSDQPLLAIPKPSGIRFGRNTRNAR